MAAPGASWAQLRQQARQLESQTESLFHTYSQFSQLTKIPPQPTEDERKTAEQITEVLDKRDSVLASLTRILDSDSTPSALKSSHLARHREILAQHRQDSARFRSQLSAARDRANLLSTVRSDISAYRAAQDPASAEAEYMLDERGRLDNSHNMADSVLSQAYAVNENFGMQREQLERIRRRVTGVVAMVPGVNGLIQRIGSKRRRDGVVLGSLIAFCVLALLYFL